MLRLWFLVFFFSLGLAKLPQAQEITPKFELLHLWAVPEEAHALDAFAQEMRKLGVDWQEQVTKTNFTGVRTAFSERLALEIPPTGVQWIGGQEDVIELYHAGVFRLIDDKVNQQRFSEILLPEVYDVVKYEEGILLLPVGIHILNHVVYNLDILEEINAPIPQSWDEFLAVGKKAQLAGYSGLSISDERWQLRNLMMAILVDKLSAAEFDQLMAKPGNTEGFRAPLLKAFTLLRHLQAFAVPNNHDLPWAEAVKQVVDGKSMANVIGDFSSPLYPAKGRFHCDLPPGNRYVLWAFDTVALTTTENQNERAGQQAMIEVISQKANHIRYISRKGGLPAFKNVDAKNLNACSQRSLEAWNSAESKVLLRSTAWAQSLNLIAAAARNFWLNPDVTSEVAVDHLLELIHKKADLALKSSE